MSSNLETLIEKADIEMANSQLIIEYCRNMKEARREQNELVNGRV